MATPMLYEYEVFMRRTTPTTILDRILGACDVYQMDETIYAESEQHAIETAQRMWPGVHLQVKRRRTRRESPHRWNPDERYIMIRCSI